MSPPKARCQPLSVPVKDRELQGRVYHPADDRPARCVVILVHGFAGDQNEGGLFPHLATRLASQGCVCFTYDARGRGESGDDYGSTRVHEHVEDLNSVRRYIAGDFEKIPQIGLGFSLGAAIVGLSMRVNRFDALAYLCPATRPSLSMWPRYSEPGIQKQLEERGWVCKPGTTSVRLGRGILEDLKSVDLGEKCFKVPVPLLVMHGTADPRIDIQHSEDAAKHRNGHFRFEPIDSANHSFKPETPHWDTLASTLGDWLTGLRLPGETRPRGRAIRKRHLSGAV